MFSLLLAALLAATPARAAGCQLNDCTVAEALHVVPAAAAAAPAWMLHDLALARASVRAGAPAAALTQLLQLDAAVRAHLPAATAPAARALVALHGEVDGLVQALGGHPLPPLPAPAPGPQA